MRGHTVIHRIARPISQNPRKRNKAYLQKCVCVLRAMSEGGTGPLLTMSALSAVQAYIKQLLERPQPYTSDP